VNCWDRARSPAPGLSSSFSRFLRLPVRRSCRPEASTSLPPPSLFPAPAFRSSASTAEAFEPLTSHGVRTNVAPEHAHRLWDVDPPGVASMTAAENAPGRAGPRGSSHLAELVPLRLRAVEEADEGHPPRVQLAGRGSHPVAERAEDPRAPARQGGCQRRGRLRERRPIEGGKHDLGGACPAGRARA
jgi:hypothetical protein